MITVIVEEISPEEMLGLLFTRMYEFERRHGMTTERFYALYERGDRAHPDWEEWADLYERYLKLKEG